MVDSKSDALRPEQASNEEKNLKIAHIVFNNGIFLIIISDSFNCRVVLDLP